MSVVVQLDCQWPGGAERYRIHRGGSEPIPFEMTDWTPARTSSGDKQVLKQFLTETRKTDKAKKYLLVLWGHSFGLGFGRDHGDALSISELKWALEEFAEQGKKLGGKKLDLLGANACAMSYAEAAFELQKGASYLVASEITMPFAGWPYANILEQLSGKDPEEAGVMIVEEFLKSYRDKTVALSLLDLQHAKDLFALKRCLMPSGWRCRSPSFESASPMPFRTRRMATFVPSSISRICAIALRRSRWAVKRAATALSDSLNPVDKDKVSAEARRRGQGPGQGQGQACGLPSS